MKDFFCKLGYFLGRLRVWALNFITVAIILYLVVLVFSFMGRGPEMVDPQGKVLIIDPVGMIVDQEIHPEDFPFPSGYDPSVERHQTRDIIRLLRAAAEDEQLAAVLVDFSNVKFAGYTTLLQLAEELAAVRASGKPVIAYSEIMGTCGYLMAAQADEIYVHNAGAVAISGVGGYRTYIRELADKLKITMHNYSQGEFKSAVEGRTRSDMSPADRLQREELYGPIWETLKQRMGEARGIDPAVLQDFADGHSLPLLVDGGFDALKVAEEQGIIDGTMNYPEFSAFMIDRFGEDEEADSDSYPQIAFEDYVAQMPEEFEMTDDAIAVVFVQGAISPAPQGPDVAGAYDIQDLLREAHEDESTRAVVLRVNSPGGSIIGSDIIAEEFRAAKDKGLPIYVSMGDVAASGGVWVSMPADQIYAEPTTITGSIGVAVVLPTFENALDHIGVNLDGVTTSRQAGWSFLNEINPDLDALFARWAGSAYERFVDNVATSREREPEYIRSIAGGRVWSGERALELGLVDAMGNLEDAIAAAAEAASLEDYRVHYVVPELPWHTQFLQDLLGDMPARIFTSVTGLPVQSAFGRRMAELFGILEGMDRPTATVLCSECMVELQ